MLSDLIVLILGLQLKYFFGMNCGIFCVSDPNENENGGGGNRIYFSEEGEYENL